MNKNDIDIINNILNVDNKIYTIYNKLSEMIENDDYSLYNKWIYMLKILIISENNLYSNFINKDYSYLWGLLEYIESNMISDVNSNPIYAICDYNESEYLSYYRIYNKIKIILMNNNHFIEDNLDNDLMIFKSNKDDSLDYIKFLNYNMALEYHRFNIYFLSECDDLEVVKRKYFYSFLTPMIENEMIDNDFKITKFNFWDNIKINSKYNVFDNYIFSKFGLDNSKEDLQNLIDFALIDNFDILTADDAEDMVDFNSIVCSFKTGLLFLSDEDIIELRKWVTFYSNNILDEDGIKNIDDLTTLEDSSDDLALKIQRLEDIQEYIYNILDNVDSYRQIANKDSKGKTFRL